MVVRVWLPDRPGALGLVASRIGAVGGDVVGIDILERDGGLAIDEFVVGLEDSSVLDLMLSEVREVEGAAVEAVWPLVGDGQDAGMGSLELALALVDQQSPSKVLQCLASGCNRTTGADWTAVVRLDDGAIAAFEGAPPPGSWLSAFVFGARGSLASGSEPQDMAWSEMAISSAALVLGRQGRPFRAHERKRLDLLAGIADRQLQVWAVGSKEWSVLSPTKGALHSAHPAGMEGIGGGSG